MTAFQALSISKSLLEAKIQAEKGEACCEGLKAFVVESITQAGGRVDYAEVNSFPPVLPSVIFFARLKQKSSIDFLRNRLIFVFTQTHTV